MKPSPGQKRKLYVLIICAIVFAISTYFAANFYGKMNNQSLAWTNNSYQIQGLVTELSSEEEEYRNRKGRKRTRMAYYVSYQFDLDGDVYDEMSQIDDDDFELTEVGKPISITVSNEHDMFEVTSIVESELADNNIVSHAFSVGIFTAPVCLFLYYILSLIFVRESANALPEGFYNEHSWLDIDDNYLVWLSDDTLYSVSFYKNHASNIQSGYQQGQSFEELIALISKPKVNQIPLADITESESRHNSDVLTVSVGDDHFKIEFLNQAVKHHALERLESRLPAQLGHSVNEKTRLMAALPWLIIAMIGGGIMFYFGISIVSLVVALFVLVKVMPKLIARLISPTVIQLCQRPEQEPVA